MSDNISKIQKLVSGNLSFERLLRDALGDEKPPVKKGKNKVILALAKTDPGREQMLNHENERVRALMRARIAVRSWPLHQRRVQRIVSQAKACGGFMPIGLKYYGAKTGRWSGDEMTNLQNLPARSEYALVNQVRSILAAPPGHTLVVTDLAQVEARNLAWAAGQEDLIQAFAEGREIYCEFVSEVLGKFIRKPRSYDPDPVVKYLKHYRMLGKVGVLGAGYQMGAARCLVYAHDVYHIDIDRAMAEKIIGHYREKNKKIVKFWRDLEKAMLYVTRYPSETCVLDRGLVFCNKNNAILIRLPSGRSLYYHQPEIFQNQWGHDQVQIPDERQKGNVISLYGGYLCENIIQATSRDILGEAILELESRGYPVALTAHDEVIAVVPESQGESVLKQSIEILSTTPIWMAGCPLAAEGMITERYQK